MVKERNIAVCILLSIITFGIYGLYWMYEMNNETNSVSGETNDPSGGMVILFCLITCGIYAIYWYYKMGKKLSAAGQNKGIQTDDNSILYLILSIIGLSIINDCLIQSDLNKFSRQ